MSYYFKEKFAFSTHAIQRLKQRLKLHNLSDIQIQKEGYDLLRDSDFEFEVKGTLYFYDVKNKMYFIVNENSNLIMTYTQISYEKKIKLLN